MGGNAISLPTRRLEAKHYHPLAIQLVSELRDRFDVRAEELRAYRNKPDFGDMDILVERETIFALSNDPEDPWQGVLEWAKSHGATEFVATKGPSLSFGIPLSDGLWFPVELQAVSKDLFDTTRDYYAWNDLSNLIGRVAHKMGLKFGHMGLLYPMHEGPHFLGEILVTQDTNAALTLMGYDAPRWQAGFDTLEDIFKFAVSTPYFNPEAFSPEQLNNRNRTRNRKRKTFMEFVQWLEHGHYTATPYVFPEDKTLWLPDIRAAFPQFAQRMDDALASHHQHRALKERFNGKMLSEWTGLSGEALGLVMAQVRRAVGGDEGLSDLLSRLDAQQFKSHIMTVVSSSDPVIPSSNRAKPR